MKNASPIVLLFVSLYTSFSFAEDEEGKLPTFQTSTRVNHFPTLEDQPRGFRGVLVFQLNESATNRFSPLRHLDFLRHDGDMRDYASSELRSVLRDSLGDSLRQVLVEDSETSLPIVSWFMTTVENVTSGKFARFIMKMTGGLDDQIVSPFDDSARGLPLQDRGFSSHKFNFGIRPFRNDNPYVFAGGTFGLGGNEFLELQCRVSFKDWNTPVPEFVLQIPLDYRWSFGAGVRYETDTGFQSSDRSWNYQQDLGRGTSYFGGIQGPFLGGWFFVGTGYPVPLTMLFIKKF